MPSLGCEVDCARTALLTLVVVMITLGSTDWLASSLRAPTGITDKEG